MGPQTQHSSRWGSDSGRRAGWGRRAEVITALGRLRLRTPFRLSDVQREFVGWSPVWAGVVKGSRAPQGHGCGNRKTGRNWEWEASGILPWVVLGDVHGKQRRLAAVCKGALGSQMPADIRGAGDARS